MILIVDAYNVIHKHTIFEQLLSKNLEKARDEFVRCCAVYKARSKEYRELWIVFDGQGLAAERQSGRYPGLTVIYSDSAGSADRYILDQLHALKEAGKNACIVSDDNYIRNNTKAFGGAIMPVDQFCAKLFDTKKVKGAPSTGMEPEIAPDLADQITEEYRRKLGLD